MVKPTVLTKNITIQLEPGGIATITPQQVDNGSFDACGVVLYSLNKTTFDCSNVGANTVTLTVKDANANTASGTATVTVVDNVNQPYWQRTSQLNWSQVVLQLYPWNRLTMVPMIPAVLCHTVLIKPSSTVIMLERI